MKKPYITVYLLNKNYAQFIEESIESLLSQTCKDFELLIIDNASCDNSKELLKNKYSNQNLIFLEESLKLTEVGNLVAKLAKGDYFIRLDADDWVTQDFIAKFYKKLKINSNVAAIFPNYHEVDTQGHIIKTVKRFDFDSEVSLFDLPAHGACTLLSKKDFLEIGGYDGTLDRQDGYDLWLKIIKNFKVSNISDPLFFYRQHDNNLTKSQKKLLEVRSNILYKHSVKNGLNIDEYLFVISIKKNDDFFGHLSQVKQGGKTLLNNLIDKIYSINSKAVICLSSESDINKFSINNTILFSKRKNKNQSLKESIIEACTYSSNQLQQKFKYVVNLTIDYPFLDSHYILSAISYINYFETNSVDSVSIEDSLLFKHSGDSLEPAYNNTVMRFERDTLYKKAGGITIIKVNKLNEYDGISTSKMGHIIIDKLSSLRIDSVEMIDFLTKRKVLSN